MLAKSFSVKGGYLLSSVATVSLLSLCNKINLMHYLSSVYLVNQTLHVSGIFVAGRTANRQSTEKHNTYQLLYIYSIPTDDGLQIYPKHVEVDWRN